MGSPSSQQLSVPPPAGSTGPQAREAAQTPQGGATPARPPSGIFSPPGSAPPPVSHPQTDASTDPPPLTEGILRVKVPAERIAQFLATRCSLFRSASTETIARIAGLMQGLECAEGAEIVSQSHISDGMGILFSGAVQILLPGPGGELIEIDRIVPGDSFGEIGALLGKPSPFIAIAEESSRVLWLPSQAAQGMVANVGPIAEALLKRVVGQLVALAGLKQSGELEVITDIDAQLLQVIEAGATVESSSLPFQAKKQQQQEHAAPSVIAFAELRDFDLSPSVLSMVPSKTVRMHRLLPVKLDGRALTVAMVNPRDQAALAELRRALLAVEIIPVAIGLEDFTSALIRLKLDESRSTPRSSGPGGRIAPESFVFETVDPPERETRGPPGVDDSTKFVNRLIAAGIEREASDIHIEPIPSAAGFRVRFRVQGMLQDWSESVPPGTSLKGITSRIKVLAGLDITERRMPQDGRIGISIGRREVDLRVSTLPANRGEKIALRILEAAGSTRPLDQIFYEPDTLTAIRRILNKPFGGIVVAGPTGSGKTSTLYSMLNERKQTRPDTNIIMAEDPIEYRLPGATQVQVNPAVGLGFAQVLRSMLRQDPDVIAIGEMRDEQTAQIALESAMTGHLLLTSLHANDPVSALGRLEQLGCSRSLIAQAIQVVIVQRLVRKLCQVCRKLDPVLPILHQSLVARGIVTKHELLLPRPVGCDACAGSGYIGRAAVIESLILNDAVRQQLAAGVSFADLRTFALEDGALTTSTAYARYLLQKQIISANEVLLSFSD
jgi:type IV pilus assembly protein PilB